MGNGGSAYILFEIAGATYALSSEEVRHIEMVERVTPVPNAASFVEGLVFSRGQVIPAVSLRVRFGFSPLASDLRTRLLVVQAGKRAIGLLVDSARHFVHIPAEVIEPPHEAITDLSGKYLKGIATLKDRIVLILDLAELLNWGREAEGERPRSIEHTQETAHGHP